MTLITLPLNPYFANIMEFYDLEHGAWQHDMRDLRIWLKIHWRADFNNQFFLFEDKQDRTIFVLRWS